MKELLNIPEGYRVIFVGGGASMQFCMVPFNCLEHKAAYLNTGVWSKKAIKEAKAFGEVVEVATSAADNFTHIPEDTFRSLFLLLVIAKSIEKLLTFL